MWCSFRALASLLSNLTWLKRSPQQPVFFVNLAITYANVFNLHNIADTSDEVIRGLKINRCKTSDRDIGLIYTLLQKIDPPKTSEELAEYSSKDAFLFLSILLNFLMADVYLLNYILWMNVIKKERLFNFHKSTSSKQSLHLFIFSVVQYATQQIDYFLTFKCCSFLKLNFVFYLHFWKKMLTQSSSLCISLRYDNLAEKLVKV